MIFELLFYAVQGDALQRLIHLEKNKPPGWNLLHIASEVGNPDMVEFLLKFGVDINAHDDEGNTALHIAASKSNESQGHINVVKALLNKGAKIDIQNNNQSTPILNALLSRNISIIKLLLAYGADCKQILKIAVKGNYAVLNLLLEHGSNHDLWYLGCMLNNEFIIKRLLDAGADKNTQDNFGNSAIHVAAEKGHVDVVRLLLENGADMDVQDNCSNTAISKAAEKGHVDVVRLLLEKRADMDAQDKKGNTAMSKAAENGHKDVVILLVDAGAGMGTVGGVNCYNVYHVYQYAANAARAGGHEKCANILENKVPIPTEKTDQYAPATELNKFLRSQAVLFRGEYLIKSYSSVIFIGELIDHLGELIIYNAFSKIREFLNGVQLLRVNKSGQPVIGVKRLKSIIRHVYERKLKDEKIELDRIKKIYFYLDIRRSHNDTPHIQPTRKGFVSNAV